jgi:hypothetical protein
MLLDLMAHVGEALYVAAWDGAPPLRPAAPRENWRRLATRMFEYKANRVRTPESSRILSQLPELSKFFDLIGVEQVGVNGLEADDCIGILSRLFHRRGRTVFIYSNDSDLFQLVDNSGVFVVLPLRGGGLRTMDEAAIEEKIGVPPALVSRLKALMGDASDGYKPVPTYGPQRARVALSNGADPAKARFTDCRDYAKFGELGVYWPRIVEAYKLSRIPRVWDYSLFPELYRRDAKHMCLMALGYRLPKYSGKGLDKRVQAVIDFCARLDLDALIPKRRDFFRFSATY